MILVAIIRDSQGGLRNLTKVLDVNVPKTMNALAAMTDLRVWLDSGVNEVYQLSIYASSVCQYNTRKLSNSVAANYKNLVDYMNERVDLLKEVYAENMPLFTILSKTESVLTTCEEV